MFKDINIQRLIHGAGAKACDYKHDRLWVRFPLEEMKYKYFSFLRFGVHEVFHFNYKLNFLYSLIRNEFCKC